jgi:hypothetical protein
MSNCNTVTEYTRQELATRAPSCRLRRWAATRGCGALAIAAYKRAGRDTTPDAGIALMIAWVMQACDELERGECDGQFPEARS